MPVVRSVAESNNVAATDVSGTAFAGVTGVARAGSSASGVGSWFEGTYGAIRLNADGTFTYRLDNSDPDTNLLAAGEVAFERFTYTYVSNGITQTDTITIQVSGADETNQAVTTGSTTRIFSTDTTIAPLQRFEIEGHAASFVTGEDQHLTLTNRGAIHAEGTETQALGVWVEAHATWTGTATLVNDGLISVYSASGGHMDGVIASSGPASRVINNGVIRVVADAEAGSFGATGVGGSHIYNHGTIEVVASEAVGINAMMGATVENSGFIYVEGTPIHPRGAVGIRGSQMAGATIVNSGTIHAVSMNEQESIGVTFFRDSTNHYAFATVVNSGTIVADIAVQAYATSVGGITGLHMFNSGRIEGAYDMDLGMNLLVNEAGGVWIGRIAGGIDQELIRNRGRIDGPVDLGAGNDAFDGRGGTTTGEIVGGDGLDTLFGGASAETLSGGNGVDHLEGGGGADTLTGGADADIFFYRAASDSTSSAYDTITDFQTGIDRLHLGALAPSSVSLSVSGGYTFVTAQTVAGTIKIRVGGTIVAADIVTAPVGRLVSGTAADEILVAVAAGSELRGLGGADVLEGSSGADLLDGGAGADLMRGGAGDDIYHANDYWDLVIEMAGEGTDELRSSESQRLQAHVENLTLTGSGHIFGTGNEMANRITGNSGHNELWGDGGDDILTGGLGADGLLGGGGRDLYVYLSAADSVSGAADRITFTTGDDLIDLRAVAPTSISIAETMLGYWGSYRVSNVVTVETASGTMVLNVDGKIFRSDFLTGSERRGTDAAETILGTAQADVILGGAGADTLEGGAGADTISGQEGDDLLDGGGGADTMTGGRGHDTYRVDSAQDIVWEDFSQGQDTVLATVSYTLGAQVFVEVLAVADRYSTTAINLSGNTQDNRIFGNDGANILDGGVNTDTTAIRFGGSDTLVGYGGDDTLIVDGPDDVVVEEAGGGFDTVLARYSYHLAAGAEIEVLAAIQSTNGEIIHLTGNEFGQTIRGDGEANRLDGAAGNDVLDGGAGADILIGGLGDDVFIVDRLDDSVTEAPSQGQDTIVSSVAWTLANHFEHLVLTGSTAIDGTGNAAANRITGNVAANILDGGAGDDRLDGGAGADVMKGGSGNDTYVVGQSGDQLVELAGGGIDTVESAIAFTLAAEFEHLTLTGGLAVSATGNGLANRLTGNAAANRIDGKAGADIMAGGDGNDTYFVDQSGDRVIETSAAGGTDSVHSAVSYTLGANVENLALTGSAALDATGNALANRLTGNGAANLLNGGAGADVMVGGAGDDIYVVDNVRDRVVEQSGGGIDLVRSSVSIVLSAEVENVVLTGALSSRAVGNALDNRLTGNGAANLINGGLGADIMAGGGGNDTYVVDNARDRVMESAGGGIDTVQSSITLTLAAEVENLVLTGSAGIRGVGNALNNRMTGNAGANVLNGALGADVMIGGAGNDIYIVDNSGDRTIERAGGGVDTVQSSVTLKLAAEVENLVLTGSSAIDGTGNGLANRITGNGAANLLNGGLGADRMAGGAGDDTYVVDNSGDQVVEGAGGGIDTVRSSVTLTLAGEVENLLLTGSAALDGTGNGAANAITGNGGANRLSGGSGDDVLAGRSGGDTLIGGSGADSFVFDSALGGLNVDSIGDFSAADDTILLDRAIFAAIGSDGSLAASAFALGTTAADADDRILYDQATGRIWYDADGSGGGAAILFAQVSAGTALTHLDFSAFTAV